MGAAAGRPYSTVIGRVQLRAFVSIMFFFYFFFRVMFHNKLSYRYIQLGILYNGISYF